MSNPRASRTGGQPNLASYACASLTAAVMVLLLKLLAWHLTGSVGLLSDALETVSNVGGAIMAVLMLRLAAQPPDDDHAYGHSKAEYFSSGLEGLLIFLSAALIISEAVSRLNSAQPLRMPVLGIVIAAASVLINLGMAVLLRRAGRRYGSITLTADASHLLADVWTTIGVIAGLGLVVVTDWIWLDAVVAIGVAVHVLWTGFRLVRDSVTGLMDVAWPDSEQAILKGILDEFRIIGNRGEIDFHAIRTRCSASRRFVDFHALVPGHWSVKRGHDLVEKLEDRLAQEFPFVTAMIHLEPSDDPASYADDCLDRSPRQA